jgi:hypothetical protein
MGLGLSLALIVRDEALHLPQCLQSFQPLAAEICVVDTGSTDGTPAIAESLGARVTHHRWNNSFAEARNVSLGMCGGAWILVVDADERLAPEDIGALKGLLDGPSDRAYRFTTRNYTHHTHLSGFQPCQPGDRQAHGHAGWFPSVKLRLFPNGRDICFEGVVHELVNASVARAGLTIAACPVPIHHYPLTRPEASLDRKRALYVDLGRAKARENPDDPRAHRELGNQYAEMGDFAAAAAAYRAALHLEPGSPETLKDLGGVLHMLGHEAEAQTALELAVRLRPDCHEGWRNLGVVLGARDQWPRAARCFRHALKLHPAWHEGHRFLSVALERSGRLDDALHAAQAALERLPGCREAAAQYAGLMVRLGAPGAGLALLDTLLLLDGAAPGWRHARDLLRREVPVDGSADG